MIVFSGDWHLHPWKRFSTINKEGYNSRLWEQLEVITAVVDWANDHGAKYFIIPGDIFHAQGEYLNKDVIRAAYVLLDRIKAEVILLPGNHDIFRGKTVFRQFKDIAHIITSSTVMQLEGEDWGFIPYRARWGQFERSLSEVRGADYLVCHQMFTGTKVGPAAYDFRLKEVYDIESVKDFKSVVSGHCHRHQLLDNVWYVGSPLQTDFNDEGDDRGFMFYSGGEFSFLPVAGPKFETLSIDSDEGLEGFTKANDNNHYLRVHLHKGYTVPGGVSHRVEVHKEGKKIAEERVKTENKSAEVIIKEALAAIFPDHDQEALFHEAMKVWGETDD